MEKTRSQPKFYSRFTICDSRNVWKIMLRKSAGHRLPATSRRPASQATQARALSNIRIHGDQSPHSGGAQE